MGTLKQLSIVQAFNESISSLFRYGFIRFAGTDDASLPRKVKEPAGRGGDDAGHRLLSARTAQGDSPSRTVPGPSASTA